MVKGQPLLNFGLYMGVTNVCDTRNQNGLSLFFLTYFWQQVDPLYNLLGEKRQANKKTKTKTKNKNTHT